MNTTFNSLAFYTCNHGYRREGRPSRTCQLSGTWSGVAPRCQGNMFKSVTYIGLPLRRLGGGGGGEERGGRHIVPLPESHFLKCVSLTCLFNSGKHNPGLLYTKPNNP